MTTPSITPGEVDTLVKYVYDLCGILLDQSKAYLLESRLSPLLKEFQCANYHALYDKARSDPSKKLPDRIVDAISTGETSFFRDTLPFELLKCKLLPDCLNDNKRGAPGAPPTLSIWSAACSTGQEAYSIAMTLKELPAELPPYRVTILGTDISGAAIAQASSGCYNKVEIGRGLSPDKIARYFDMHGAYWRIKDELRAMVTFRKLNLLEPFVGVGTFDIIFCRNVAIYFSQQDRTRLFDRLAEHLKPGGALVIGSTESLSGVSTRYVRKVYYNTAFYQLYAL